MSDKIRSGRTGENRAAIEANWPFPDRRPQAPTPPPTDDAWNDFVDKFVGSAALTELRRRFDAGERA